MSGRAETVRRAMVGLRPDPLANGALHPFAPPLTTQNVRDAQAALDALLAENQRLEEFAQEATRRHNRLLDENQRLREVVDALLPATGCTTVEEALEALAGDTE